MTKDIEKKDRDRIMQSVASSSCFAMFYGNLIQLQDALMKRDAELIQNKLAAPLYRQNIGWCNLMVQKNYPHHFTFIEAKIRSMIHEYKTWSHLSGRAEFWHNMNKSEQKLIP